MPALREKGIVVKFHQARRNARGITVTSAEYRETPDLTKLTTHSQFIAIYTCERIEAGARG